MRWNGADTARAYEALLPPADSLEAGELLLNVELGKEFVYAVNGVPADIKKVEDRTIVRDFIDIKTNLGRGNDIEFTVLRGTNTKLHSEDHEE